MKKRILSGLVLLMVAGVSSAADSMVFVDLERAFSEFYKTKLSTAQVDVQKKDLEAEQELHAAEMKLVSEDVDALKKDARDLSLPQEVRDEKRILYEERLLELRALNKENAEFLEHRKKQLQMQVSRIGKILMDEIRQTVIDYARTEGIKAVIDSSKRGAAVSVFVYTHTDVDITDDILIKLNSTRPTEGTDELLFGDVEQDDASESEK
jgi:Skp family chaperone for outer membrane proteins